jgi:Flp pilus assembly pilin Flp
MLEESGQMPSRPPSDIRRLVGSRRGATAVEYALVVALISVSAVISLTAIGQWIQNVLGIASTGMT